MAEFASLDALTLPPGFEWGAWSGSYRPIFRGGEQIGQFGGVLVLITPAERLQSLLNRECERMLMRHNNRPKDRPI